MSKDNKNHENQEIAKQTQKILKDQGYQVKLGHIYELFSKLSGVKDWNSAKALKVDFKNVFSNSEKSVVPSTPVVQDDEIYLGKKLTGEDFIPNLVQSPGVLLIGNADSYKTNASLIMLSSKVISKNNCLIKIVDLQNLGQSYKSLLNHSQIKLIKDTETMENMLEETVKEIKARSELFKKHNVNNIAQYENSSPEKMPRIIIHLDNLPFIVNSQKYFVQEQVEQSCSYNLKMIARIGRSFGVFLTATANRATLDDFPISLKPGFSNILAFKINHPGDGAGVGLPHASEINPEDLGLCVYEDGNLKFPLVY